MEQNGNPAGEYYSIDLIHIFKSLWKRAWLIALAGILAAAIGFSIAAFVLTPQYSSSVMMYVNNSSINLGNTSFNITQSDITASQSLVKTYGQILDNRTTLELIIEDTGVSYTYRELSNMITSGSANGTEIMIVTVTSADPYEASEIANSIAQVLPRRISEIIDGATMEIVDSAIPILTKVSPSITKYTAIGLLLGVVLSAGALALAAFLDDTIYDEEYVLRTYEYAILAKVPDLLDENEGRYSYKSKYAYRAKTR